MGEFLTTIFCLWLLLWILLLPYHLAKDHTSRWGCNAAGFSYLDKIKKRQIEAGWLYCVLSDDDWKEAYRITTNDRAKTLYSVIGLAIYSGYRMS